MSKKPQKKDLAKTIRPGYDPESKDHYNSILMEEIRSQMKTVIDGVEVLRTSTDRQFAEFRKEVSDQFEVVNAAIRHNSQDIKTLGADVKEIRVEMKEMEKRLSDKIDKVGDRVDNHEVRITNLETVRL